MTTGAPRPTYVLDDEVAVITLDDGKANAIGHEVLGSMNDGLDRALSDDARAVVIAGRDGRFSAGFDLATMSSGTTAMRELVARGGRFYMRLYGYPLPTVAACTGHALAGGAILLLALDQRVGTAAPCRIGLNEVAIGMGLPSSRWSWPGPACRRPTWSRRPWPPGSTTAPGRPRPAISTASWIPTT